jgi:hypothetical protein
MRTCRTPCLRFHSAFLFWSAVEVDTAAAELVVNDEDSEGANLHTRRAGNIFDLGVK